MAEIHSPEQVKVMFGLLYPDLGWLSELERALSERWGVIDLKTEPVEFAYTNYYSEEMGQELMRSWLTMRELVSPEILADIKVQTNAMEKEWSQNGKRVVNIDPGYLALSKLVLASAKNFSHRIYLSSGIYAEVTLIYREKSYRPLPWTYADYKDAIPTFNQWRNALAKRLRARTSLEQT